MKISFVTTSSISTNPRLVKEVLVAQEIYKEVEVVCFKYGGWTDELDEKLIKQFNKNVHVFQIEASKKALVPWLLSSFSEELALKVSPLLKSSLFLAAVASNKRALLLILYIYRKNLLQETSLLVGHNLGALFPAFYFSKKRNIPFAFDVEDYHPCEVIGADAVVERERRETLMKTMLQHAAYVTAASPLIGNEVEKLCTVKVEVVNNSFLSSEFIPPQTAGNDSQPVQLVWFSQNISYTRGLELLLPALDQVGQKVKLFLIGNLNQSFAREYLSNRDYVQVLAPVSQDQLHALLSGYDAGLALELKSADYNREIALTNKIFAYKQAGLYVLATDTKAQSEFLAHFEEDSRICAQTIDGLAAGINYIIKNIVSIRASRQVRYEASKRLAFENEAKKLIKLWEQAVK